MRDLRYFVSAEGSKLKSFVTLIYKLIIQGQRRLLEKQLDFKKWSFSLSWLTSRSGGLFFMPISSEKSLGQDWHVISFCSKIISWSVEFDSSAHLLWTISFLIKLINFPALLGEINSNALKSFSRNLTFIKLSWGNYNYELSNPFYSNKYARLS